MTLTGTFRVPLPSDEVTYRLTALTPEGAEWLRTFAAGYPDFLRSWESAIAGFLHRRSRGAAR